MGNDKYLSRVFFGWSIRVKIKDKHHTNIMKAKDEFIFNAMIPYHGIHVKSSRKSS